MTSAQLHQLAWSYLITFGWAMTGAISTGAAMAIMLKLFTWSTREIDEWKLVEEGNLPIAIILSSLILGCAIVVAVCVIPPGAGR